MKTIKKRQKDSTTYCLYDKNGHMYFECNEEFSKLDEGSIKYDDNENVIHCEYDSYREDLSPSLRNFADYKYDSENRLLYSHKKGITNNNHLKMEAGTVIYECTEENRYDDSGHCISFEGSYDDIMYHSYTNAFTKEVYDEQGYCIKSEKKDYDSDAVISIERVYENGLLMSEKTTNSETQIAEVKTFEYNEKKQLIRETTEYKHYHYEDVSPEDDNNCDTIEVLDNGKCPVKGGVRELTYDGDTLVSEVKTFEKQFRCGFVKDKKLNLPAAFAEYVEGKIYENYTEYFIYQEKIAPFRFIGSVKQSITYINDTKTTITEITPLLPVDASGERGKTRRQIGPYTRWEFDYTRCEFDLFELSSRTYIYERIDIKNGKHDKSTIRNIKTNKIYTEVDETFDDLGRTSLLVINRRGQQILKSSIEYIDDTTYEWKKKYFRTFPDADFGTIEIEYWD